MEKFKISFVEQLTKDIEQKMEKGLYEYEVSHGIDVNYKPFALVLYDGNNEVAGVLDAFMSYSSIHIKDLWVDKSHRGDHVLVSRTHFMQHPASTQIELVSCS